MIKNFLLSSILATSMFAISVEKVFETPKEMKTSESVILDNKTNFVYVANINGKPLDFDGNGFISKLSSDGEILNLHFADGMDAPKGMGILNNKLYVSDINKVHRVDLETGKIEKTYTIKEAKFLNDIAVSRDGVVFVSDFSSENTAIYTIIGDEVEKFLDEMDLDSQRPNGLWVEEKSLVVGTKSGTIFKFTLEDREKSIFKENIGTNGIDGILPFGHNGFITSDWAGRVFISDEKSSVQILDTTNEKINAADIWYDAKSNMLYVPTFFDDRVIGYKVSK